MSHEFGQPEPTTPEDGVEVTVTFEASELHPGIHLKATISADGRTETVDPMPFDAVVQISLGLIASGYEDPNPKDLSAPATLVSNGPIARDKVNRFLDSAAHGTLHQSALRVSAATGEPFAFPA